MDRVAYFNGRCPLCDRHIVRNRSYIESLPEPMAHPSWMRDCYDAELETVTHRYSTNGYRSWAHAKCYRRWLNGALGFEPTRKSELYA